MFVRDGLVLGGWLLGVPVYNFLMTQVHKAKKNNYSSVALLFAAAPAVAGARLGAAAHQGISKSVKDA